MPTDASPPWNVPPAGPGAGSSAPLPSGIGGAPLVAMPAWETPATLPGATQPGATQSGAAAPPAAPVFPARIAARQVAVPAIPLALTPFEAAARTRAEGPSLRRGRPKRDPFRGRRKFWVSLGTSTLFHCLLVIIAGLIAAGGRVPQRPPMLYASLSRPKPTPIEMPNVLRSTMPQAPRAPIVVETPNQTASRIVSEATGRVGETRTDDVRNMPTYSPGNFGVGELLTDVGGSPYGMLDGRDGPLKAQLLEDTTPEGEQAVYRGLKWLAAHQRDDGGWHFDHRQTGCKYCANPGTHGSMTAATGLALLPFLGAGHTHKKGEFQETVRKGLDFLKGRVKLTPLGGDLQDGVNLYSQAIATLALCEAYAMTEDRDLFVPCYEAVRFIVNSQHKPGGGWRYFPGQVGDTTVTGWMLMALKSAQLAYIPVPPDVWPNARHFLDLVQDDGGAAYGYQSPEKNRTTMTAIGLLCRMYTGWPRSHEALGRGVRSVGRKGPSKTDLYFDYYATQTMRHYGGTEWHSWNGAMREFLITTQEERGHMSGSWYFADQHGDQGGRVYNTAMAVLILEVYYRYLPIYGFRAVGEDFRGK